MRVGVAGTFGPLHAGHRALLETALERGEEGVVVGLTNDEFANRARDREVPPFQERKRTLRKAIGELNEADRPVEIRRIDDRFGTADEDPRLDAIVVSEETTDGISAINDARRENGLEPLEGIVVPVVTAEDGERISSTRIAGDEIDAEGRTSVE